MTNGTVDGLPPLAVADRLDSLRALFDDAGVDALLVTGTTNVRYLTGFTGSAGNLWVDDRRAVLITDGRYSEQAPTQIADAGTAVDVEVVGGGDRSPVSALADGSTRIGLEARSVTWSEQQRLAKLLDDDPVATDGLVEALREVKDDGEVARLSLIHI